MPSASGRSLLLARAHSPNAPSTCSHAPCSCAASAISRNGSNDPVFTLPACAQMMIGPCRLSSRRRRRSARILPCPSVSTRSSVRVETDGRSEEHTSELQSLAYLVCRLLLEKKKKPTRILTMTMLINIQQLHLSCVV